MKILLCNTEKTNFSAKDIADVVNSLQFFFVVHLFDKAIEFGPALGRAVVIDPTELSGRAAHVLEHAEAARFADFVIVLTSARVATDLHASMQSNDKIIIISNHDWREKGGAGVLRFARVVLHVSFRRFVEHRSAVETCIAGLSSRFDCLCDDCERQLRAEGFRDGIYRLKEGFNILNQLASGADAEILPRLSDLFGGRLRLGSAYAEELKQSLSLSHLSVLLVLHFLSDLVPFVKALTTVGIRPSNIYLIAKPYPYARRDEVSHVLQTLGVNIYRASKTHSIEKQVRVVLSLLGEHKFSADEKLLIIEDGGYFAPAIHEPEFEPLRSRCVGAVEQTQKGANADREIENAAFPILSVAESTFKKIYESPEIGRVAIQNISRFTPDIKLSAGNALVVGFGSVGQQVAFHLTNAFNMTVSVIEQKELRLLEARHRKTVVAEAVQSFGDLEFKRPKLVVGTTGRTSITREILEGLHGDVVLVSTSSDQVEIDLFALDELSGGKSVEVEEGKRIFRIPGPCGEKQVTLLAEGYPINFYGSESVPNDTIDPIMTLLFLCGIELATKRFAQFGLQEKQVDEIVEQKGLVRRFLELS
jgi:S-adenosylhomocysteine hydrolase